MLGNLLSGAIAGGAKGSLELKNIETNSGAFDYQIYLPPFAVQEKLPLLVFLHGITQRGTGGFIPADGMPGMFVRQQLAQIPAIVLFPQCRPGSYWSDPVMDEMVSKQISRTIEDYAADAEKISLIGVSMGGYGVWHFAFNYPNKFASLVSICGGSSLTGGDRFNPLAEKVGKTPVWLFHGADDKIVQVSESRQIAKALEAHGGSVKYDEYPDVGHNVWFNALAEKDLMPWILEQVRLND